MTATNPILIYGRMIKFSHSIFAMPFALSAAVLASRTDPVNAVHVALIIGCMVTARSCAMGVNRIVDRTFDAKNPRTAIRELPSGQISLNAARGLALSAAVTFVLLARVLNPLCGALSPVALAIICGYSYAKRFTALVHLWLGVALGIAPVAAWIAITGTVAPVALVLAGAVATWVAGFDILYSLQDEGFDRGEGLHSIPVALGQRGAMVLSALLHLVTVGLLAAVPALVPLGWGYWAGFALISGVLAYEHAIIRPGDLSRIDKAFFDLNGYVSLLFFAGVCAGTWLG
ncbi:MAG: 4-hydroxybenzoate octaprenyltransferase [Myxococcales bacterium]|nr:4-hydroxybenzoate octaprenyltransferase [Myxococcales bacterium]